MNIATERPLCAHCSTNPAEVPDEVDGKRVFACRSCRDEEVKPVQPPRTKDRILRLVRMSPGITVEDLAQIIDDSYEGRQRISKSLNRASKAGAVTIIGSGNQHYFYPRARRRRSTAKR